MNHRQDRRLQNPTTPKARAHLNRQIVKRV